MERLFKYMPEGKDITTNDGNYKIMVIRKGPRGIVARVKDMGPIIIWGEDNADAHVGDSEADLIQKTIDVLNG